MGADLDNSQTSSLSFTSHEKELLQTLPITHSSTNVEVFVATAGALANTGQKTATKSSSHEKGEEIPPNQTLPGTKQNSNAKSDKTDGASYISTLDSKGTQASAETDVDHPRGPAFQESQNTFVTIGRYMYLFSYIFTKSMTSPRSKIRSTTVLLYPRK